MESSGICSLGRDRQWGGGIKMRWERGHMAHEGSMASGMLSSLAGNHLLKAIFAWEL